MNARGLHRRRLVVRTGYTLVELMMTVTLLAIAAAVAMPSFEPNTAAALDGFADVVAADLAQVRQLAVTNNSKYRLTFEASNNRYYLEHTGTNSALNALPATIYRHPLNTTTKQYFDLAAVPHVGPSVKLNRVLAQTTPPTGVTTLEFGPLGSTTQAADTVIWLECGAGTNLRYVPVRINAVTGLAVAGEIDAVGPSAAAGS